MALACAACAHRGGPPPEDATRDPEFQAALRASRPEFPRQRDALQAGLYEPFVPPESLSLAPVPAGGHPTPPDRGDPAGGDPARGPAAGDHRVAQAEPAWSAEDPSTEELLRSLPGSARAPAPTQRDRAPSGAAFRSEPVNPYTLQLGAFGEQAAALRHASQARAIAPGFPVELHPKGGLVRVLLGRFSTREDAEAALRELAPRGLGPAWVTRFEP